MSEKAMEGRGGGFGSRSDGGVYQLYRHNYCAALIKRRQQIRLLLLPNFASAPGKCWHRHLHPYTKGGKYVGGESILHGSNSLLSSPPTYFPSHPTPTSRIYFTTKQKISERLGLRCLGLLHRRGSNRGRLGHGGGGTTAFHECLAAYRN